MRNFRKLLQLQGSITYAVAPDSGVHIADNPGYVCYSGEEVISHELADGEIIAKALDALDDMEERFDTDFPNLNPKKFRPAAMGVQMIRLNDPEQRYKIYYHSSMKQNKPPVYSGDEVQLAQSLENLMIQDDETIPVHRRNYRCTEPGLITNSDTAHPGSSLGSRFYIVDQNGQYLPPCGSDLADDAGLIGCKHILAIAGAIAITAGPATSTNGDTTSYLWYHRKQVRPQISCRINSRESFRTAHRIALKMRPDAAAHQDRYIIAKVADKLIQQISCELDRCVAFKMTNRLHFSDAHQKASEAANQIDPQMASLIAREICPQLDPETISVIFAKVIDAVVGLVANQLAVKPTIRSRTSITVDKNPHPVTSMTVEQLKLQLQSQEPPKIVKDMETRFEQARARGELSAFEDYLEK
jgi:hypothetical protein